MKKKLIFITEALWIGGIETALVNLLNHLDYKRYDVTCLILRDYQDLADRLPRQCHLLVADRDRAISFSEQYPFRRMFHLMEKPNIASKPRIAVWKALQFCLRGIEMDRYAAYIKRQMKAQHFSCLILECWHIWQSSAEDNCDNDHNEKDQVMKSDELNFCNVL